MKPKELLNALVQDIATITGDATSEAQAIAKGKESYLFLEYASVYGGYRLVRVKVVNGGHSNALPGMSSIDARLKAPAMEAFLRAIIIGLNYQKPAPAIDPEKTTDIDLSDFYAQLVPFGSLDVDTAISTAKAAGKDATYAASTITEYMEQCGPCKLDDIDCVAQVYEDLLQIARNEITELTGYDFMNDCTVRGEIYTAGNYCATSYDSSTDALQELTQKLADSNVIIEDCTEQLQWFLDQMGINQQAIEEAKTAK